MFLRSCWSSGYKTGVSMTWKLSKNTHPARILFCPYIYLVPLEKTKKNMLPLLPPSKPHTTPATVEECSDQNTSPAPPQETEAKIFTTISVFRSICCGKDSASQQTESNISRSTRSIKQNEMQCMLARIDGRAITTTCGHILCTEDASKVLSNDAACPICDQVLSKSHMKPVDINPNDEWINMATAGLSPQMCILWYQLMVVLR
ncbi:E3 ubiquitin-protein ligase CCNB1IP1 homolog [Linum perenne]